MPNPHYKAGVRFEYEIVNLLKKYLSPDKYTIIRTAGSHSPVDVLIIKHLGCQGRNRSFGIQAKTKKEVKKHGTSN